MSEKHSKDFHCRKKELIFNIFIMTGILFNESPGERHVFSSVGYDEHIKKGMVVVPSVLKSVSLFYATII